MAIDGSGALLDVATNNVVEYREATLTRSVGMVDANRRSDTGMRKLKGREEWTVTGTAHWDKTDAGGEGLVPGAEVQIDFYPEGSGTGDRLYSGLGRVSEVGIVVPEGDDTVQRSFTVEGSDGQPITESTV